MNKGPKNSTTATFSKEVSDETILKVSKEIVVKFIEMGKISPAGFDINFQNIYESIHKTVRNK